MSISKTLLKCLYEKKYAELPSSLDGKFDIKIAYQVAMEICEARDLQGEKLEGIKVGFTNMNIWKQYNVNVPIFGPMYSSTVKNYDNKFKVISTNVLKYFDEKILELSNLTVVNLDHNELEFLQLKGLLNEELIKPLYLS